MKKFMLFTAVSLGIMIATPCGVVWYGVKRNKKYKEKIIKATGATQDQIRTVIFLNDHLGYSMEHIAEALEMKEMARNG